MTLILTILYHGFLFVFEKRSCSVAKADLELVFDSFASVSPIPDYKCAHQAQLQVLYKKYSLTREIFLNKCFETVCTFLMTELPKETKKYTPEVIKLQQTNKNIKIIFSVVASKSKLNCS